MSRLTLRGVVVRRVADKTSVVRVERVKVHPLYGKRIRVHKDYMSHDEHNRCQAGDTVTIRSCRPVSKRKTFEVVFPDHGEKEVGV
jgi:small subunit ribosomal protein S17